MVRKISGFLFLAHRPYLISKGAIQELLEFKPAHFQVIPRVFSGFLKQIEKGLDVFKLPGRLRKMGIMKHHVFSRGRLDHRLFFHP